MLKASGKLDEHPDDAPEEYITIYIKQLVWPIQTQYAALPQNCSHSYF